MNVSIRLLQMNGECGWGVKDHFTTLIWCCVFNRCVLLSAICHACSCFFLSTSNRYKQIVCKRRPSSLRESILHLRIFIENPSPHHAHFGAVSSLSCSLALPVLTLGHEWLLYKGLSRQINRQIHVRTPPQGSHRLRTSWMFVDLRRNSALKVVTFMDLEGENRAPKLSQPSLHLRKHVMEKCYGTVVIKWRPPLQISGLAYV